MAYYQQHVFFCTNQRLNGKPCCQDAGASSLRAYAKDKIKALGLAGKQRIRINSAGCLGRCAEGPVLVIYTANGKSTWYTYQNQQDIDDIITQHLLQEKKVERLKLPE
jgi:(2Fe-2S) ferredoxin